MALDPKNAVLPANRAMALLKKEQYGAAEGDCTLALAIDRTYTKVYEVFYALVPILTLEIPSGAAPESLSQNRAKEVPTCYCGLRRGDQARAAKQGGPGGKIQAGGKT